MAENLKQILAQKEQPWREVEIRHLNQTELARRWRMSPRTLERWRWLKQGPVFIKVGGKVVYSLADVEAYERKRRAETHTSILGAWPGEAP